MTKINLTIHLHLRYLLNLPIHSHPYAISLTSQFINNPRFLEPQRLFKANKSPCISIINNRDETSKLTSIIWKISQVSREAAKEKINMKTE